MRGVDSKQAGLFSEISPEERIPKTHPLRPIRALVSEALEQMDVSLRSFTRRPIVEQARLSGLYSDEHLSVDGTQIQAWASHKTFRPKDGPGGPSGGGHNVARDFRGEQRKNDTHASTSDPAAKLY